MARYLPQLAQNLICLTQELIAAPEVRWNEFLQTLCGEVRASGAQIKTWNPSRTVAEQGSLNGSHLPRVIPLQASGVAIGELVLWFTEPQSADGSPELDAIASAVALKLLCEARREESAALLSGAIHDVRGIVMRAANWGQIMLRDPAISGESRRFGEQFVSDLQTLNPLFRNLSQIISIHPNPVAARTELNSALDRALYESRSQLENRQIIIDREVPNPSFVRGREAALAATFRHLFDNIVKFCPAATRVAISCHRMGNGIRMTFADDGPGISPQDAERAFEPFMRLNSAPVNGHGLGLAVCRSLIQSIGGWIRIDPEVSRGTRVLLWLPDPQNPASQA